MKIVHFSDWHGKWQHLPSADLYVCTGDMLPNFVIKPRHKEIEKQAQWIEDEANSIVPYLASKDTPVVCVRGNHDFIPIAKLFQGMNVWEVDHDSTRTYTFDNLETDDQWVIGGFRGVPPISGTWADETFEAELFERINKVPDVDILISHCPPSGILDEAFRQHFGSSSYMRWINKRLYEEKKIPSLFLFGHIHEYGGWIQEGRNYPNTRFCNAATTFLEIEL